MTAGPVGLSGRNTPGQPVLRRVKENLPSPVRLPSSHGPSLRSHRCPHFRQPRLVLPVCVLKINGIADAIFKVVSKTILKLFPKRHVNLERGKPGGAGQGDVLLKSTVVHGHKGLLVPQCLQIKGVVHHADASLEARFAFRNLLLCPALFKT